MAAMGPTARSINRRDRAARRPSDDAALFRGAMPLAFEPRIHSPASWLARPAAPALSDRLNEAVVSAVIPRLSLAHAAPAANAGLAPDADDVAGLCGLLLRHEAASASACVEALRQAGMTPERLLLDLLAPAARLLGQFWADDICDFATVTLGTMQLRRLGRELAPHFLAQARGNLVAASPAVLLAAAPGDQHVFGLDILADFFRRDGWRADMAPVRSADELASLLRRQSYAVVGISVGTTDRLDTLAATIRRLRRASRNRAIGVMVGGPAFIDHPEYVALVGADATAADARAAPRQAARLGRLLAEAC